MSGFIDPSASERRRIERLELLMSEVLSNFDAVTLSEEARAALADLMSGDVARRRYALRDLHAEMAADLMPGHDHDDECEWNLCPFRTTEAVSAVLLREAASTMRERAEAAVSYPDWPWVAETAQVKEGWLTTLVGIPQADESVFEDRYCSLADATHVASWHPAVALAVADWLEGVAAWTDEGLGTTSGLEHTNWPPMWGDMQTAALSVARAYLGRDQ